MAAFAVEDASGFSGYADAHFEPSTEPDLIEILARATAQSIPVTIGGAGTGVTGGCVPSGGWFIDMRRFKRLDVLSGRATAGAGVLLSEIQTAAAQTRQFYAPDPTEYSAAIGGTIATNASGSRSFKYGDTRRHLLHLRVVLMDGRILDVSRGDRVDFDLPALPRPATTKHTAGYHLQPGMDWIDLFAGSEGTLGIVTEAEVRLLPAPAAVLGGVVFFAEDGLALDAVDAWRSSGARMLEYFDAPSLRLLRTRYPEIPAAASAALMFEHELYAADDPEIDRWIERLDDAGALADGSWFALTAADRERFRRFRHALPEAINDIMRRNGFVKLNSDFAVPLSRNREMLAFYRELLERGLPGRYVIFGHIGDAHVHINILPSADPEFARGKDLMVEFARQAVALGGTVSAEHGLGKHKAHLLPLEFTPDQIGAMKQVKRRLDPQWLLGRGTLFAYETGS